MPKQLKEALPQNAAQWRGATIITLILQLCLELAKAYL